MSNHAKIWLLLIAVLVGTLLLSALLLPRGFSLTLISNTSQALLLLSATLAALPNAIASRGRVRIFWSLIAAGIASWFVYQMLWNYFEIHLRQEVPDLFAGDIVLFLHLVPMIAALAMQPHQQQDNRDVRLGSLDFALLFSWWIYLYLFTVIPWQYALPDLAVYEHNLNAIYLAEKIVFLGGLVVVWTRSSRGWKRIYAHLFGASLLYALTSYFANWAIARKLYYTGSLYDVPLSVSMAWFTIVALLGRTPQKQEPNESRSTYGVWVARLGMLTTFSLPLFAVWMLFDHQAPTAVKEFRMFLTLMTMMLMGIMVFLKQHLLDRELLSLLRSSQQSIEDLKRLQTQLVQSEKLASLGKLVGGAAHELNNPLAAMLGYTDLLSSSSLNEEQRPLVDKIGQQVRRTRVLVASLLSFAKQTPGKKAPLNMTVLAQTAAKLCQPQLRASGIELQTELRSALPPVMGDSNQLLQVCLHIINNSLHALEGCKNGRLILSTRQQANHVVLELCDNGPGASEPERVFDPFYTTRPVGKGIGLGLSACYGIVQEHDGRISCENRAEGGASFRVELPVIMPAQLEPSEAETSRAKAAAVAKSWMG